MVAGRPIFQLGSPVAPSSVAPEAWAAAFPPSRRTLVLAPAARAGWFDGHAVVACDPVAWRDVPGGALPPDPYGPTEALEVAGAALDGAFSSDVPTLAAVLLTYEGGARVAVYPRGLSLTEDGWRTWGDWSGVDLPDASVPLVGTPRADDTLVSDAASSLRRSEYVGAVAAVQEAIRRGDVYVLNLTRTLRGAATLAAGETFAALLSRSDASMGAFWALPGATLVSASPERFLRVSHGFGRGASAGGLSGARVEVAPVKGTRARGSSAAEDDRLAWDLATSDKERSEHVMIVDLERNDLGRVCRPGSVRVWPLFEIQTTPYCHQMVSTVSGEIAPGAGSADLLAATFPCGSVTGAPKRAAMRIVSELERGPRDVYTGSLIAAVPGRMDSSVLIRTAMIAEDGSLAWGTGCGITIDSDPQAEWDESVLKTQPLGATEPSPDAAR